MERDEAVIPLNGNRKIPVEIAGIKEGAVVTINYNLSAIDADAFRKFLKEMRATWKKPSPESKT